MPMNPPVCMVYASDPGPRPIGDIPTMNTIYGRKPSRKKRGGWRAARPKQARTHDAPRHGGVKGGFDSFHKDCTRPGLGLSDCTRLRRFLLCDPGPRSGLFWYATLGAEIHREVHLLVPAVPHQDRSALQTGRWHGHGPHLPPPRSRAVPSRSFVSQKANAFPGRAPPGKASRCQVHQRCCRRWARSYPYPGSIVPFPLSLSIGSPGGDVKAGGM